jgi:hypothetical protein
MGYWWSAPQSFESLIHSRQTKISIYLYMSENQKITTVSKHLRRILRTMYVDHNPQRQLKTGFNQAKSSFSFGDILHHSPCSTCLEERNLRVDLSRVSKQWAEDLNEQIYIPEILCQISFEVRCYNIWHQDPNHTSISGTKISYRKAFCSCKKPLQEVFWSSVFLFLIEVISKIELNTIKILRSSPQHHRVFLVLFGVGKIQ